MKGSLKLIMSKNKRITSEHIIQDAINSYFLKNMDMRAFTQEYVNDVVVNVVGIVCKNCGSDQINVQSKQVRSADEATTKFFTCLKCGNKWRKD
jgi:DNA-directed RNA polymerase subunit M/transcription elongation factor TFIIS